MGNKQSSQRNNSISCAYHSPRYSYFCVECYRTWVLQYYINISPAISNKLQLQLDVGSKTSETSETLTPVLPNGHPPISNQEFSLPRTVVSESDVNQKIVNQSGVSKCPFLASPQSFESQPVVIQADVSQIVLNQSEISQTIVSQSVVNHTSVSESVINQKVVNQSAASKCPFLTSTTNVKIVHVTPEDTFKDGGFPQLSQIVSTANVNDLKPRCIAIVKEGWNKALAFRDRLFFEAFAERWFHLYPPVVKSLGVEILDIESFLYSWIDLAISLLNPATELLHRETFQRLHVAQPDNQRFSDINRFALQLVVLNVGADAMLALDEAWYFALSTHCPYFETSDYDALKDRNQAPLVRFFRIHILDSYLKADSNLETFSYSLAPVSYAWKNKVQGRQTEVGRKFYSLLFESNLEVGNVYLLYLINASFTLHI